MCVCVCVCVCLGKGVAKQLVTNIYVVLQETTNIVKQFMLSCKQIINSVVVVVNIYILLRQQFCDSNASKP